MEQHTSHVKSVPLFMGIFMRLFRPKIKRRCAALWLAAISIAQNHNSAKCCLMQRSTTLGSKSFMHNPPWIPSVKRPMKGNFGSRPPLGLVVRSNFLHPTSGAGRQKTASPTTNRAWRPLVMRRSLGISIVPICELRRNWRHGHHAAPPTTHDS